jgi:hypothetical protein
MREGMNLIDTKWIFKKKKNERGETVRYKARVVARGFTQQYGVDYRETFAPVLKTKSLRLIIALSSTTNRKIAQLDIKTAFLNADVKEDIYVLPVEGMRVREGHVLKLNKALYGIKQAPREWNININNTITTLGFTKCRKDECIYVKVSKSRNIIMLGLFVDDIIVSYHVTDEVEWFSLKSRLMQRYELSDIGDAHVILGMRITRINNYTYVDQQAYTREKLEEFNMSECRTSSTPGDVNVHLNDSVGEVNRHTYMKLVGSLMYAMQATRPDITHATNVVSRHMNNPKPTHMRAAFKVMRYLSGCVNYGLRYNNDERVYKWNEVTITGYCDADWGGDKSDRKSTTGYCVFVNENLISWCTRKQQTVALSSAEAELMAMVEVVKEVKWMSMLLEEIGYRVTKPIQILSDNQAAIKIAHNDIEHDRTKHIDIKYHFVRNEVNRGQVTVKWIRTQQQIADIFTKTLTHAPFITHRDKLVYKMNERSN